MRIKCSANRRRARNATWTPVATTVNTMDEKRLGSGRNSKNAVPKVPSFPKLHCRAPLVTTQLSKSIFKSTVGHDFDLPRPIEDELFTRYNSLHDPHTKAFFHRPTMCFKLQKNGFVTNDMKVVCSLKEYNSYREFMECEAMKTRNKQEQKTQKALETAVMKSNEVDSVVKVREEKRRKFFEEQERKAMIRQRQMRRIQWREKQERLKATEEKKLMRERNEIRREAEREQRRLNKLQQKHQEVVEKRHQLHSCEHQMLVRLLHLQHTRQSHRLQQIRELEGKWEAYDEHVRKAREEEEECKIRAKEEKEKKRKRREKVVEFMKAKNEARRKMLHEQSFHQVEDLKKQADKHEKLWREKKEHEVLAWREKIHKEQDHWQHHMHHQMESSKTEHQKQMDTILHSSYLPKCAKTGSTPKWVGSLTSSKFSMDATHLQLGKKSENALKLRKKNVRFQQSASIHIIEEDEADFDNHKELLDSAASKEASVDVEDSKAEDSKAGDGESDIKEPEEESEVQVEKTLKEEVNIQDNTSLESTSLKDNSEKLE